MSETTKYQVSTPYVLWEYVTVQADSAEDALDKVANGEAESEPDGLCAHCSGGLLMRKGWSRERADEPLYISEGETMRFAIEPYAEKIED